MLARRSVLATGIVALLALVAGGGARLEGTTPVADAPPAPAAPPPGPALLKVTPAGQPLAMTPNNAVTVTAMSGTVSDVRMVNEQGRVVAGALDADGTTWRTTEPLGFSRTYTLTATARGTDASTTTHVSQLSTVTPRSQTAVTLRTTSGAAVADGATYGVGTVIIADFDSAVIDRAAAERAMRVTTTPAVEGAWSWIDDNTAHWRPREYYPAGTQVDVDAQLYGVDLGGGAFGLEDSAVGFRIGSARVAIADDTTKQVSVYEDGKLLRTMPTSMGRGGTETVNGRAISFWTQPGTYTVMEKQNPVLMDSSTYGLPVESSSGYKILVPFAVRISPDGIYLHEREATVWAQGNTNVSAGCLNLSAANAEWYYNFARPGDIVEVRNTGGKPLQQWQNGDWSVPWQQWLQRSALR